MLKIHNVFHVSRLRIFHNDGRVQPPPLPIEIDGDLEYEVEQIYGHRRVKVRNVYKNEYLVRWKGCGVEHDEFVPEANLRNSPGKLREYMEQLTVTNRPF